MADGSNFDATVSLQKSCEATPRFNFTPFTDNRCEWHWISGIGWHREVIVLTDTWWPITNTLTLYVDILSQKSNLQLACRQMFFQKFIDQTKLYYL